MKLKQQLRLILLMAVLGPVLVLFSLLSWRQHTLNLEAGLANLQQGVSLAAQSITNDIQKLEHYLKLYSEHPSLISMDPTLALPLLNQVLIKHRVNGVLFFADANGSAYSTARSLIDRDRPELSAVDIKQFKFWQKTVALNESGAPVSVIGTPVVNIALQRLFSTESRHEIVLAVAIRDEQKQTIGMLGLSVPWQAMSQRFELLVNRYLKVVDVTGVFFMSEQGPRYWLHNLSPGSIDNAQLEPPALQPVPLLSATSAGTPQILEAYRSFSVNPAGQRKEPFINSLTGRRQYFVEAPVQQVTLSLVVLADEGFLNQSKEQYLPLILMALAISVAIGMLLWQWLRNLIIKPVNALQTQVSLFKGGDWKARLDGYQPPELQNIANDWVSLLEQMTHRSKSLRASERRFELALKGANDGLWDWDLETDVVYFSPRWGEMLGYSQDELPHQIKTFTRLLHPDDKENTFREIDRYLKGESSRYRVKIRMLHKSGYYIHILSRAQLQRDPETGKVLRLVGTHVDITEQINREREIKALNLQLEERVAIRTRELAALNNRLQALSLTDSLLGIRNRRAHDADMYSFFDGVKRGRFSYAVLMIDVDYFKPYNDNYGHTKGDEALQLIVQMVLETIRTADRMYRYGGEEFVVMMPATDLEQAFQGAERITSSIYQSGHAHEYSPFDRLTVSIGVSVTDPEDESYKEAIKRADAALYRAKGNGRNRAESAALVTPASD